MALEAWVGGGLGTAGSMILKVLSNQNYSMVLEESLRNCTLQSLTGQARAPPWEPTETASVCS